MQTAVAWLRNVLFAEILQGLRLTFKHIFVKEITDLYPVSYTHLTLPTTPYV